MKNTELIIPDYKYDKEFDVFISYSNLDIEFVEGYMVPELENEANSIKYQCIVHKRDFLPGDNNLDQITKTVDRSSCDIVGGIPWDDPDGICDDAQNCEVCRLL